jgi:hypothetical protein
MSVSQVLSILALNPKLPLHVAASYMSNTLKVRLAHSISNCCSFGLSSAIRRYDIPCMVASIDLCAHVCISLRQGLSDSTENVRGLVLSAMTDIEAITASKNSQTQVRQLHHHITNSACYLTWRLLPRYYPGLSHLLIFATDSL